MSTATTAAVAPATQKGLATRARLLDAAREIAIESGGHIEIAAVAAAAGVVPSLVHRYFGSKAGLVGALVDDFFDRFHAQVFALELKDGDWAQHERLRLEAGVHFHFAEPFAAVVYGELAREPEVSRRYSKRIAAVVERAALSVRRGQSNGELPLGVDPALAGAAMFGSTQLVMVEALTRNPRPSPERVIDVLWRQIAASVQIDPDAGRAPRS